MADETAVIDAGTAVDTSTSVETPVNTGDSSVSTPETPVQDVAIDPNDPMAALQAAMDAQLGADDPADAAVAPETPAIPPQFEQALKISEFVKSPEHVEAAIRAADEVWRVGSGQAPVSALFEGLREANPQAFQKIATDTISYIEQITGKKFGEAPATPPDPNQARLDALEARIAREDQDRQVSAYQQQVGTARTKAIEFITSKAKGTFAEGQEAYLLQQAGAKAGIPEQEMVQALLTGKTEKLEAAYRAVVKDETVRLKAYMANVVKQHRVLSAAVPAVKGSAQAKPDAKSLERLPDESVGQQAVRFWKKGLV